MKIEGNLWYSPTQAHFRQVCGNPATVPGRLKDGSLVEYTEVKRGEFIDEPSLFEDAVCLGEGEYAGK
jgi:hypothetical protein